MNVIAKHKELVNQVPGTYESCITRCMHIQTEMAALISRGTIRATPHWRRDKKGVKRYLYLIYPTESDGSRKREYIGANHLKVKRALDAVERQSQVHKLNMELRSLHLKIKRANHFLTRFLENAE